MNAHQRYVHQSPGRLLIGPGSLNDLPAELDPGLKYIVMTDPGIAATGLADRVAEILSKAGVEAKVFSGVAADPPTECVEEALGFARAEGLGGIIALGGGSSIDAAKGLAVLLTKDESLRYYGDGNWVEGEVAPLYAIPTTAGTGSEVTRVAVITDPVKNEKMAIRGVHLCPKAAVLDPAMVAGLPPRIAAETGADALTHAVEAYVSLNSNPYTDALAVEAIRLVGLYLRRMTANPGDVEAASGMLLGSCLAGQAFTNAGLGLAHSMGEPLGAFFHVSHGLACALYLPVIMDFNTLAAPEKFATVAALLGQDIDGLADHQAAREAVFAVRELWSDIGLPLTFAEAGIDFKLHQQMVDDVPPQFSTTCNPRKADDDQIAALYHVPGDEAY